MMMRMRHAVISLGKIAVPVIAALAVAVAPVASQGGLRTHTDMLLTDVTVVDVATGELLPHMIVHISGDRIAAVRAFTDVQDIDAETRVDLRGKFVIPGLWDMHVHLFNNVGRRGTHVADLYFPMLIANGVTGVRDMWTDLEDLQVVAEWTEQIAAGRIVGPRIVTSSTILDGPEVTFEHMLPVGTVLEARRVVDSLVAGGATFIKTYERLPRDVYFAIAERAGELGIPFGGHLPHEVAATEAADAGQKSIEHLLQMREMCLPNRGQFVAEYRRRASSDVPEIASSAAQWARDETRRSYGSEHCANVLEKLRENQTWQVPTLVLTRARDVLLNDSSVLNDPRLTFVPDVTRRSWARETVGGEDYMEVELSYGWRLFRTYSRLVPVLHAHGVPILVGTDVGNWYLYAGFSVHDEMVLLVEEGKLSPLASLQAATLNPARYLGALDSMGTVDENKIADLVVLDANPLEEISNTKRIHAVVLGGRFFDRVALDSMLARTEELARDQR